MPRLPTRRRSLTLQRDLAQTQFERVLGNAAQVAMVLVGTVIALVAVKSAAVFLAPIFLAIIVGLMFGPLADAIERRGVPPALSSGLVVILFIVILVGALVMFAAPLSEWVGRMPEIWSKLRAQVDNWKGVINALGTAQAQLDAIFGSSNAVEVSIQDGGAMQSIAQIAPEIGAQVLIFLVALFLYLGSRHHIRVSILSLCYSRRMRWRTAHIFTDVEHKVSRFLLSVTAINVILGLVVTGAMWAIGMPSPLLWGAMAFVLNYVPYVGQAVMFSVLLAVGLATQDEPFRMLLPLICYGVISFIEGNLVYPHFIGRQMTINPFLIFLSLTFWLWAWGPVGGLVAVPALLITISVLHNILPRAPEEEAPLPQSVRTQIVTEAAEEIAAQREAERAEDAAQAAQEEAAKAKTEARKAEAEADRAQAQAERVEAELEHEQAENRRLATTGPTAQPGGGRIAPAR